MNKRAYYTIITLAIIIGTVAFSNSLRYEIVKRINVFSGGSYAYSETYELAFSEEKVLESIEKFKNQNPHYKVPDVYLEPNGNSSELLDKKSQNGFWFISYFYDPIDNQIYNVAIRGMGDITTLEFASINDGLIIGNWQQINRDFAYSENKKIIEKFEHLYLIQLKKILEKE